MLELPNRDLRLEFANSNPESALRNLVRRAVRGVASFFGRGPASAPISDFPSANENLLDRHQNVQLAAKTANENISSISIFEFNDKVNAIWALLKEIGCPQPEIRADETWAEVAFQWHRPRSAAEMKILVEVEALLRLDDTIQGEFAAGKLIIRNSAPFRNPVDPGHGGTPAAQQLAA